VQLASESQPKLDGNEFVMCFDGFVGARHAVPGVAPRKIAPSSRVLHVRLGSIS